MVAAAFYLVLVLCIVVPSVNAVQHTVGDSNGWTTSGNYNNWVKGKTFTVGDTLLFNYGPSHGVSQLSQTDYSNCATSNPIQSFSDGQTTITLTQPGSMYFACPTLGHCGQGMKLSINVVAASGSGTPPPTPSGTPPTTPSGTPPTTPSGTPPTTPSGSTPTTPTSGTPRPPSSPTPTTTSPSGNNAAAGGLGAKQSMIWISMLLGSVFAFMC